MNRALQRFFIPVLFLGLLLPLMGMIVIGPLNGDLTRIGFLPERQFVQMEAQPSLIRKTSNVSDNAATVLVVGDSFSGIGFWQEIALGQSERYVTYNFGRICSDFDEVLKKKKLSPSIVIIQVVERYFDERFFSSCDHSRLENTEPNALIPEPTMPSSSIFSGSYGAKYMAGSFIYFLNGGEQYRSGHSGGVHIKKLANGCLLFSNRDCDLGLFLGDDFIMTGLPREKFESPVVGYLKKAGVTRIILMPIPNKTSVYLESLTQARIKDAYLSEFAIHNRVEVVPLFERFNLDRLLSKDFYLPNDTHLSARGMQVLGGYVREHF